MTTLDATRVVGWLVRDTFRRARESWVFWMMLALSGVVVLTCLSVSVNGAAALARPGENPDFLPRGDRDAVPHKMAGQGVDTPSGDLSLAFGAFRVPLTRDAREAVRFLQVVLAAGIADSAGLLLALVWTAGFLPSFLAPRAATLLLAKPVPRRLLFLGKCVGVLAFVAFQATVLVGGTWLALGVRTGIWGGAYWLCLPLLLLQFVIFFSVSALIAAHSRGTAACVLGTLLFWLLCWGMNYGRHAVVSLPLLAPEVAATAPRLGWASEVGYWALPKPADLGMILSDAIGGPNQPAALPEFAAVRTLHRFHPVAAVVTSLAAAAVIFAAAVRKFELTDY